MGSDSVKEKYDRTVLKVVGRLRGIKIEFFNKCFFILVKLPIFAANLPCSTLLFPVLHEVGMQNQTETQRENHDLREVIRRFFFNFIQKNHAKSLHGCE